MNKNIFIGVVILFFPGLSACGQKNWEGDLPKEFIPKISNRLPSNQFTVIKKQDESYAVNKLKKASRVELSLDEASEYLEKDGKRVNPSKRYFLARAVSDRRNGVYSVYLENDVLYVLWGGFGACDAVLIKTAILVETDRDVESAYTGCTGVD